MAGTDLELPKGITIRNGYLNIAFTFNKRRYRLNTIYKPDLKNVKTVEKLLTVIRLDLEREQFYLSNYSKHFNSPEVLTSLDISISTMDKANKYLPGNLLNNQLTQYQSAFDKGRLSLAKVKSYQYVISKYIEPLLGSIYLAELSVTDIEEFIAQLNLSKSLIAGILAPLRAIYKREFKQGIIKVNPFNLLDGTEITQHSIISSYIIEPFNKQEKEVNTFSFRGFKQSKAIY